MKCYALRVVASENEYIDVNGDITNNFDNADIFTKYGALQYIENGGYTSNLEIVDVSDSKVIIKFDVKEGDHYYGILSGYYNKDVIGYGVDKENATILALEQASEISNIFYEDEIYLKFETVELKSVKVEVKNSFYVLRKIGSNPPQYLLPNGTTEILIEAMVLNEVTKSYIEQEKLDKKARYEFVDVSDIRVVLKFDTRPTDIGYAILKNVNGYVNRDMPGIAVPKQQASVFNLYESYSFEVECGLLQIYFKPEQIWKKI